MRYFNKKSKNNRSIVGILGVLLLILGVVSLIFQYSTTVQVYGQVNVGPFFNMGFQIEAIAIDSDSDGTDIFLAYERGREGDEAWQSPVWPRRTRRTGKQR